MKDRKGKIAGIIGTVVLHAAILVILVMIVMDKPQQQAEGGVPVMLGMVEVSSGSELEAYEEPETEPEVQPEQKQPEVSERPVITQDDEPSVSVKKEDKKKQEKKKTETKKEQTKPKEKTAEEIRREQEEAREKKTNNLVSGAFGKGSSMGSHGTASEGKGQQGSPEGNSTSGGNKGAGGFGSYDLAGRGLGPGGLPSPEYNVKEEGTVVVDIWVSPSGKVVKTGINRSRTNTSSPALRNAAEKAARRATFSSINGVENQKGTITYNFKLK